MASSVAVKRFLSSNNLLLLSKPLLRPVASTASRSFNTNVMIRNITPVYIPERNSTLRCFTPCSCGTARHFHGCYEYYDTDRIGSSCSASESDDELDIRVSMSGLSKEDVKISVEQNIRTTIEGEECAKESLVRSGLALKIYFELTTIKGEGAKESKDEEDGVCRRCNVKISVGPNVTITGEGAEKIDEEGVCRFTRKFELRKKELYKFDQIKAEMKDGELQVIVPTKWLL